MPVLERSQLVYAPLEDTFRYFSDPRNLPVLTPGWMNFTVTRMAEDKIFDTCEIDYRIRWMGLPRRWTTIITDYERNVRFVDQQKKGPFKRWWHEHRFERIADDITLMTDRVEYEMPFGPLGGLVHAVAVRRQLLEILEFRAGVIGRIFRRPARGGHNAFNAEAAAAPAYARSGA